MPSKIFRVASAAIATRDDAQLARVISRLSEQMWTALRTESSDAAFFPPVIISLLDYHTDKFASAFMAREIYNCRHSITASEEFWNSAYQKMWRYADEIEDKKHAATFAMNGLSYFHPGDPQWAENYQKMWLYTDAIDDKSKAAEIAKMALAYCVDDAERWAETSRKMWGYADEIPSKLEAAGFARTVLRYAQHNPDRYFETSQRMLDYADAIENPELAAGFALEIIKNPIDGENHGLRAAVVPKFWTYCDAIDNKVEAAELAKEFMNEDFAYNGILRTDAGYKILAYAGAIENKAWAAKFIAYVVENSALESDLRKDSCLKLLACAEAIENTDKRQAATYVEMAYRFAPEDSEAVILAKAKLPPRTANPEEVPMQPRKQPPPLPFATREDLQALQTLLSQLALK